MGSEDDRALAQLQASSRVLASGRSWEVWRCTTCYLHLPVLLADLDGPGARCPICGGRDGRVRGGARTVDEIARSAEQGREWRP